MSMGIPRRTLNIHAEFSTRAPEHRHGRRVFSRRSFSMRASTAYFAGAGTVIVAIAGGIGGGLLFADIVSPKTPKAEMTRLEQRMSTQPIQVKADPTEPAKPAVPPPVTTAAAASVSEPPPAPATEARIAPSDTSPTDTAATQPTSPAAQPAVVAPPQPAAQTQADAPPAQPSPQKQSEDPPAPRPAQKLATTSAPEDAVAKARDVDLKRAAAEKRRAERREQWSQKRRYQRREDPDQELREVEAKVREQTETGPIMAFERVRTESPRIRLFGLD
jgi:hypothetical protein